MQFLKTLFWVALGIVLVLFSVENWSPVTIELWGGLAADVKKPVLVLVAFLLGFLPTLLIYRTRLWTMRRKLETAERNVAMAQMAAAASEPLPADGQVVVEGADQRMTGYGSAGTP
jgi:lipopolysaccharide assembly protein A